MLYIILFYDKNNTLYKYYIYIKSNNIKSIKFEEKITMGVGGIFIGTLALIFAIVIIIEIKERFL